MFIDPNETSRPIERVELPIPRRSSDAGDKLADLAAAYLDRQRQYDEGPEPPSDERTERFTEDQQAVLARMCNVPALTLDDVIGKLQVIAAEIWDRAAGHDDRLDYADLLTLRLADDFRRVLGASTAYRFDARLWVESAICAGMEPIAMIYATAGEDVGCQAPRQRRLGYCVGARVDQRYAPPLPTGPAEIAAVLDELERRGRTESFGESLADELSQDLAAAE